MVKQFSLLIQFFMTLMITDLEGKQKIEADGSILFSMPKFFGKLLLRYRTIWSADVQGGISPWK